MSVLVRLLGNMTAMPDVSMVEEYSLQVKSAEIYSLYVRYVVEAFNLHSFLIIGTVFTVIAAMFYLLKARKESRERRYLLAHFLLYAWIGFISGA